jgi:hypothetical protein
MLPDPYDQEILLSYMAAVVQRPGEKFQWCPVVQGVEGNGKSILYTVLEYAVSPQYSHKVNAKKVDSNFNAWVEGNIFGCVEEIRLGGDADRVEAIKELVTNSRMPVEGKGANQVTGDNCVNFIFMSNHHDAVPKTQNDRRYCIFYTAQQEVKDLQTEDYYTRLYEWIRSVGCKRIAHYLHNRNISVNVMGRAPATTSTAQAYQLSLGLAEQIVIDHIELGTPGFRGDVISSTAVSYVLANAGRKPGPKALNTLLKDLGYVKHPAPQCVQGERFRAYVPEGSLLLQAGAAAVKDRYITDNAVMNE